MSKFAHSQLTVIPTGTNTYITDLVLHNDTLIISGKNNYFAKSIDFGSTITIFSTPGPVGYSNFDFQIIDDNYYILSVEGLPYDHNYILKSSDFGNTWDILYDTLGLFTTFTMLDSNFGVIGGTSGAYAMTQGSDTAWTLDTLYSTIRASKSFGDSTMLMMAVGSISYITKDRGQNWTWVSGTSYEHQEIQFINKDTIYAVSNKGTSNPKTFFYYSFNGGSSWSWIDIGYNSSTLTYDYYSRGFDLFFDSPKHGYIVGYNYNMNEAVIFETNDFGQNWVMNPIGIAEELYDFLNINDSIAFFGGANGTLLKWNKSQGTCWVTLTSSAASCPTCNDACITTNVTSACPPYTYNWFPNDPNFPSNCSASPFTTYTVTVTDACGCSVTDSITTDTVTVTTGINTLSVLDLYNVVIYPNPSSNTIRIKHSILDENVVIQIINLNGEISRIFPLKNQTHVYDIKELSNGIYFIRILSESKIYYQSKLIKE